MLAEILGFISRLSVSVGVGAGFFFTAIVTPSIFSVLPRAWVGPLLRILFPRYYLVSIISFGVALAVCTIQRFVPSGTFRAGLFVLLLVALLLHAGAALLLQPKIQSARDQLSPEDLQDRDDPRVRTFGMLHGISFVMNGLALLAGVAAIYVLKP